MRGLAVVLVLAGASGCAKSPRDATPTPSPVATHVPDAARGSEVVITTPGGDLTVATEVVATGAELERGLMFREFLAPDAGMLFLMGSDRDWAFWMRNTLIPLDMIFITKDLAIAGIAETAVPKTDTLRKVGAESRYVLEVNGGWCAQHGVKAGARVRFVAVTVP